MDLLVLLEEDLEKSDTAKSTLQEWTEVKKVLQEVMDEIDKETEICVKVVKQNYELTVRLYTYILVCSALFSLYIFAVFFVSIFELRFKMVHFSFLLL